MNFELMHKNDEVASISLDENGRIIHNPNVISLDKMPPGTVRGGFFDSEALKTWWITRSIPASRSGIRDILERLGLTKTTFLSMKSMGVSLTDHYWIRPEDSDMMWEEVNFFDNPFTDDVGNLLFGKELSIGEIDLASPDNTTEGNLKKKWKISEGKRCLLKSGTASYQEPFNEVIAYHIAQSLKIPCVKYDVVWEGRYPLSVCENFVTKQTEFVSAYKVYEAFSKGSGSHYEKYVRCCNDLGLDIVPFLDRMIVFDYIIANFDRHFNNFGLIRDADTLEWVGPAPLFDNGSCLYSNTLASLIYPDSADECKPFKKNFREQIELVSSLEWIDFEALDDAIDGSRIIMESSKGIIDGDKTEKILALMHERSESLKGKM